MLANSSHRTVSINSFQLYAWPASHAQMNKTKCQLNEYSINHLILLLKCAPRGRQPLAAGRWLSYSGVVWILFPEQLRAVAERLCRCHVIHSVPILKVSMCCAGVCPGVHRRFPDYWRFFLVEKKLGCFVGVFFRKEKYFLCEMSVLAADMTPHEERYCLLLDGRVATATKIIRAKWKCC